ncbi:methyltransferase domain-containing protein [Paucibacter sp. AS339]|uniref:methyltransferase domain-containing protein n=1 Tax=Paucibacter hankyongi TaxID=3133434 RepID=UPI0030ACCC52
MDQPTSAFYDRYAKDVAARYEAAESAVSKYFPLAFAPSSRVLDVGAGSGRDMAVLTRQGYEAYGVEPSAAMRERALQAHPHLSERLLAAELPAIGEPFGGGFDGLLCSAVLMHVPDAELFDAAFALRKLLKPFGRLLISLPLARDDLVNGDRDKDGRLFQNYTPEAMQLLLERLGFQQIGRWDSKDSLGRGGVTWYTLLFELRVGGGARAVDQIEGILNRDKKEATYKLALFRALAEMAVKEPRCARWLADGWVSVPLRRIAEKWLAYYWPIFASERFVPQSRSEGAGSAKQLKFRAAMIDLMQPYRQAGLHGGLSAWQQDLASHRLRAEQAKSLEACLKTIEAAIREGPVRHSGLSSDAGSLFSYDGKQRLVLMRASLWQELSLLGHWVTDAVILRWASLTESFSLRQQISAGDALPLLLALPEPKRATLLARQVFEQGGASECVWSRKPLRDKWAVDHVIPFSLWGNNDLWNLMPVDGKVNGSKSDKLPTADLLRSREPLIVEHWRLLREALPEPFDAQASQLLGRPLKGPLHWEQELFSRMREAVELTAMQRGVERWEPVASV